MGIDVSNTSAFGGASIDRHDYNRRVENVSNIEQDLSLVLSRNTNVRYGERRQKIIEAAIIEFSQKGFAGATMRGIGQRGRVNHQLVVHHFKNMDGLWRAVMEQLILEATERLASGFNEIDTSDPRSVLESAIDTYIEFAAARPELHRIMLLEAETESERMEWLMESHLRELYGLFTTFIKDAQNAGVAGPESPIAIFYGLIGAVNTRLNFPTQSLMLSDKASNDPKPISELRQICRRLVGLIK